MVAIWVSAAGGGLRAVGDAEQQVADALQADHELHAGEKFAGFSRLDFGDGGGDGGVDLHVERVEFALALAQRVQQRRGAGGDAFGGGSGGFFGEAAGFDGAAHDVMVGWFGWKTLDAGSAHEGIPLAWAGVHIPIDSDFAAGISGWSTPKHRASIFGVG